MQLHLYAEIDDRSEQAVQRAFRWLELDAQAPLRRPAGCSAARAIGSGQRQVGNAVAHAAKSLRHSLQLRIGSASGADRSAPIRPCI
jgi:hypothetical protein